MHGRMKVSRWDQLLPNEKRVVKKRLRQRDGDKCWLCGLWMPVYDRTVDHLVEQAAGGTDDDENLALTHERCNARMAGLSLDEKEALRGCIRIENPPTLGEPIEAFVALRKPLRQRIYRRFGVPGGMPVPDKLACLLRAAESQGAVDELLAMIEAARRDPGMTSTGAGEGEAGELGVGLPTSQGSEG